MILADVYCDHVRRRGLGGWRGVWARLARFPGLLLIALVGWPVGVFANETGLTLRFPLSCTAGVDCWIANYVDRDVGPGASDYTCGRMSYPDHTGTDFAVRDLAMMRAGVPVLAAAAGSVRAVRQQEPDSNVNERGHAAVRGRECGNGVVLEHAGGWQTQYCHLLQGSVRVRVGQQVEVGQTLGLVGMSGLTEYPHLHLTVRQRGRVIDPFDGGEGLKEECGSGAASLWHADDRAALAYRRAIVFNYGVAGQTVTPEIVRSGSLRALELDARAPWFVLWLEAFAVTSGDVLEMRVDAPDGQPFLQSRVVLDASKARIWRSLAKRRKAEPWPVGVYACKIALRRAEAAEPQEIHFSITVR